MSENTSNDPAPDPEDLPNDFFDDFSRAEFIEGLSVIDSWDDEDNSKRKISRINKKAIDSVQDLRELIHNSDTPNNEAKTSSKSEHHKKVEHKKKKIEDKTVVKRSHSNELDHFIQPGSRRDPNKTKKAILRDKQEKVKEHLAKSIDSIKPPGTELDDFCEDTTLMLKKSSPKRNPDHKASESTKRFEESRYIDELRRYNDGRRFEEPSRHEEHKRFEDRIPFKDRRPRGSPHRFSPRRSPRRRFSPNHRFSPRRYSPHRRSPHRLLQSRSPNKRRSRSHDRRRSPERRMSPAERRKSSDRKQSPDVKRKKDFHASNDSDSFLYPKNPPVPQRMYETTNAPKYPKPSSNSAASWEPNPMKNKAYDYTSITPQSGPVFPTKYAGSYKYAAQPGPPGIDNTGPYAADPTSGIPQDVPTPARALMPATSILGPLPTMVPAPVMPSPVSNFSRKLDKPTSIKQTPYDALAQLVAEGKITKEDYEKLAPNQETPSNTAIDDINEVQLFTRCQDAVGKLSKNRLPNRLIVLQNIPSLEPKSVTSKYCSPLKRQPMVEFQFTQPNPATLAQQNKQLIDNIAIAIGFDKFLSKPDKKERTSKDAAVQTSRPYCDVCEIRDSTKYYDAETSTKHEYFTSSVHTQVVDQDLASSKSLFASSGSIGDGRAISIAHLTPAQLVSQLAAKAKTLKQNDAAADSYAQYGRRNTPNNYDYERSGHDLNNRGYRY